MNKQKFLRWTSYLVLLLLVCSVSLTLSSPAEAREVSIFQMDDPEGDDKGPGTYQYPMRSIFDPKEKLFDLTKFAVAMDEGNYYFDISLGLINNPWGAPEGFSQPIIQIYLDTKSGGKTETLNEGAYVNFAADHGWEYLIKVVSWGNTAVYHYTDHPNTKGKKDKIKVKVLPDQKTIRVTIPQSYFQEDPESWNYYVLVGSQDGLGPDNYRMVMEKATEWQFGGGTDTNYDPNVIDILAPPSGPQSQVHQLAYSIADNQIAELQPVMPSKEQKKVAMQKSSWWAKLKGEVVLAVSSVTDKYPFNDYYPAYTGVVLFLIIILVLGWVNFGESEYFKDDDK